MGNLQSMKRRMLSEKELAEVGYYSPLGKTITFYSPKCLGQETMKKPFGVPSLAATYLTAYYTQGGSFTYTVPFYC